MHAYSLWQMPWLSFFSKKMYQEIGLRGKGGNIFYLLLLLAVCLIPPVVSFNRSLHLFALQDAPKFIQQVPEITISQGIASLNVAEPYEIRDPITGDLWVLIDTRDLQLSETIDADTRVKLTRTRIIFQKSKYETRVFDLAKVPELLLNQNVLWKWLRILLVTVAWLSFPCALLYVFSLKLLQALFFSIIGLMLCALLKAKPLAYGGVFRITILALTPTLLLKTLVNLFDLTIPAASWIYFCLTLGYLFFGVYSIAQEQKRVLANPPAPEPDLVPEPIPVSAAPKPADVAANTVGKKITRKVIKKVEKKLAKKAVKNISKKAKVTSPNTRKRTTVKHNK